MTTKTSLVKNGIFNGLKVLSSVIFPVASFAYAARILGDSGVGRVTFARSIVSYFIMLAMLGMNYYGTREAAKLRDDQEGLSRFSQEMLLINAVTTLAAYFLMLAAMVFVPGLQGYAPLLLISSVAIVLQGMGMEWLYQAIEEYRYIALRSILFQFISLAGLLLFVRNADDVLTYAVILLVASSGPYVLNFVNARKFIRFRRYPYYEIKKHLKPLLWLFAMAVSIELYTVLDSTMLGFLQGDAAVGRYTAAVKVNKMVNSLITATGATLIPRLSYFIAQNKIEQLRTLVNKAFNYMFMFSVPACMGLFMLSDEIILLFSGSSFASAGLTMRILTPIVVIIPFSVVVNLQIFVPMGRERLILLSTMIGAITNFTCNMLLIPRYAENGAAVATVLAEGAVTAVCFKNIGKFYDRKKIFRHYYQYWIAAMPIPIIVLLARNISTHCVVEMCIAIPISVLCYFAILGMEKNPYFIENMARLKNQSGIRHKT